MCENCWKEDGAPSIINGKTIVAATLMESVYNMEGAGVGGHGHIVFDDSNFDDEAINYCLGLNRSELINESYPETSFEFVDMVLKYLLTISEPERHSAEAIRSQYFESGVMVQGAQIILQPHFKTNPDGE